VHNGLRKNITNVLYHRSRNESSRTPRSARPIRSDNEVPNAETLPVEPGFVGFASTASIPVFLDADQSYSLKTATGETIKVTQQIQLYVPNGLLKLPLVSPALSYLGGLPPLLFIAGDREDLRRIHVHPLRFFSVFGTRSHPQSENLSESSFDAVGPSKVGGRSDDQASAARISMAGEASVYARNWVNTPSLIFFSFFHNEIARRPPVPPSDT
jgi:hypothetical protein